jgi:anti-sigma-K factor RskA
MSDRNESRRGEELRGDAAAYVLGAMSELEQAAFRVKMMREYELGRYVESLERVGDAMLASTPLVAVPDSIGVSILQEARRDLAAQEILESPRGRAATRRPTGRSRFLRPLALAATLLLIAVGAFAIGGGFDSESSSQLAANFSAPAVPGMSGEVKATDGGAVVDVSGMESDLNGDVYQLWVQHDNQIYAAPVFSVSSDGSGHAYINRALADGDTVMITREPAGGSPAPTTKPLASAQV